MVNTAKNKLRVNIAYQMFYEILVLVLPLVTSPYISRVLGVENVGIFSYTYSIALYFGMIAMLGVRNHGSREIAKSMDDREKVNSTFTNIYAIQVLCSLTMFLFYAVYIALFVGEYRLYATIQILYVAACMIDINWLFFGLEEFRITVVRNSIIKVVSCALIFLFVRHSDDLWVYCMIIAGSAFLSQVVLWAYVPRYVALRHPDIKEMRRHLRPLLLLFVPVVAVSIYNIMDKIMVGAISTKTQLGFYENAERLINCTKTVITAFGTVMLTRMSRLVAEHNVDKIKRYMRLSIEAIMFIAFAIAFGVASVAEDFAQIYWGPEFAPCGVLLIGLVISLPFAALANAVRTQYIIPNNYDKIYVVAVIVGAVSNVTINGLLIPTMGARGAVAGTIIAEGVVCIIQCAAVRKEIELSTYCKRALPFFLIGIIMFFVVKENAIILPFSPLVNLLAEIAVGGIVYVALAAIYAHIRRKELYTILFRRQA